MGQSCIVFGAFDGMHRGHLALIEKLAVTAKERNLRSVVISIPSEEAVLSTEEEKQYYLQNIQIDEFVTRSVQKAESVEIFVKDVLLGEFDAKVIIAGADRDLSQLKAAALANGIEVIAMDAVTEDGTVISTAEVLKAFENCDFEKVTNLCGHPYVMIGEVEHGKALGRTVGMPTANLGVGSAKKQPPFGVYATYTHIEDEACKGLTNIGKRPSVDDDDRITIETYLLDFSKDIYGKKLIMEVHLYIRGVVKFDNLEEVQNQVQKDLAKTRSFLDEVVNL